MSDPGLMLLPGVDAGYVTKRLTAAGGKELESGKFFSEESSSALAANCFGWFHERPKLLPAFKKESDWHPVSVETEYCARFPWSGGRHPWLDAAIKTSTLLVGVESKRYEPFRSHPTPKLSEAYRRPVWGEQMRPFEEMCDALMRGELHFRHLDAAQLTKHAFGLVTDAKREDLRPVLVYLYAEPTMLRGRSIPEESRLRHRDEIRQFANAVQGAAVRFEALSYREWLGTWSSDCEALLQHRDLLLGAYDV